MHCFFCHDIGGVGDCAELEEADFKHLFKTLRARTGEKIELTNGNGCIAIAEITDGHRIIVQERQLFTPPARRIHLFTAPPKKQKMDQLLKQCAETGIWTITPMLTARTISTPEKKSVLERWRTLLQEGCKQSKNPFLPDIVMPVPFEYALDNAVSMCNTCYFGSPANGDNSFDTLRTGADTAWFVGPEGGFTETEETLMRERGFTALKIGDWVMRVETAVICGAAVLGFCGNAEVGS